MTTSEDITRGHELYLRHILLLGQAAPVPLKAILEREVSKRGKRLADLLAERKDTFNTYHNAEFRQLFKDEEVNTDFDSWDTLVLCVVVLVLFDSYLVNVEVEAIKIIKHQRNELEKFAHSASITYKTFEEKFGPLHSALLELNKGIHDEMKFECTRMIYSFKSEDIRVNLDLIKRIKQTHDVKLHLQMVIQDKIAPRIHGDIDQTCDKDDNGKPLEIRKSLHVASAEADIRENMDIVLTCEVNRHTNKAVWRHNGHIIEEHTKRVVSTDDLEHRLTIRNAKFEDEGDYTVYIGGVTSSVNLSIKGQPVTIIENLHVTTVESDKTMHDDIVLLCTVDQPTNNPVWRHNNKEIKPSDRLLVSVEELEHRLTIRDATLEDEGDYTVDFGVAKSSTSLLFKENPVFTKRLQDTFVYVGEPAIIACKLNVSGRAVTWRHDYQPVEETDNLTLVANNCSHWLAILNTKLTDSGYYSCVCGLESTKACLKVSERPLLITEELHVATTDADVRENMDIVLICAVNLHTNEVLWQHNGTDITQGIKHLVTVQGLEHKLTIRNAKFEDDGDYTVAFVEKKSSTNLTIKGTVSLLHKKQLTEDMFKNWIRGALGIKYLKLGIQEFAENSVQSHHFEIMKQLPSVGNVCTNCTEDVLLPSHTQGQCPRKSKCLCSKQRKNRRVCQSQRFCSKFYDKILFDHRFFDLTLTNTDIQSWGTDPWSVATCYINTTGYRGKLSAKEVDCSGLLSLLINNTFIHRSLGDVEINGETDLFRQARDARNDILHNANYELSEGQLQCYIDLFKAVLEIKDAKGGAPLSGQPGAQDAIGYLNELQLKQIDIRISQDFQKQIQDIKEHARDELAEKIEEAEKQNYMKVQELEQQLKMTEKDLQLMRDLRSTPAKNKPKDPFKLELHIQVNGPTGETSTEGNRRIYQTMKKYVERIETPINATDESVYRLLRYISRLKGCKTGDDLKIEKSAYIKIHCLTCEAIERFLKLINGNEFQEEVVALRKCLEREEHIKIHNVMVCCSSESIENTRKRLYDRGPPRGFTCSNHKGTQCTWYCSDHDIFCCSTCKDLGH
ncbi:uncharacterized protein LOC128552215, partial [Mercenaria mercenaria]|uniref:uncharacterized protein LOC128552215 n=1 Tax=Mercenaria mercenaria TaxID=6596 RepID=UPI00234EBAAF